MFYPHTVFPDPWITCPDNVVVTLSPGANKADVSALLQDPKSNQPPSRITITPGQYLADKMFPAGTTILTYVATNPNGKTKQCQATVIVQGLFLCLFLFNEGDTLQTYGTRIPDRHVDICGRGKKTENPEKNQQQSEPTYSSHPFKPGPDIGRRRELSPLRHPCIVYSELLFPSISSQNDLLNFPYIFSFFNSDKQYKIYKAQKSENSN